MINSNYVRKAFIAAIISFFASTFFLFQIFNIYISYKLPPINLYEIKNSERNYRHIEIVEYEVLCVIDDESPDIAIFVVKVNDDILLVKSHKDRESYSELSQMLSGQHSSNSYIIDGYFKRNSKDYIHQIDNKLISQPNMKNSKVYYDFSVELFADDLRFTGYLTAGVFLFVFSVFLVLSIIVLCRIKYPYNSIFEIIRKSLWALK